MIGGKKGGKIQEAHTVVMKPENHGGKKFVAVLAGQGQELEKDASSRGSSGNPRDQARSNMEKAGMKEMQLVVGDRSCG
jgi:hypothetical protein